MNEPHVNEVLDGSPGGFIEAVKRTLVVSLRRAFTDSGLSLNDSRLNVDMEYPDQEASYPAAWVQFSFTNLTDSGLGHIESATGENGEVGEVRQWRYEGQVTVTFMALSSLDRDRISDKFISIYAFSDIGDPPVIKRRERPHPQLFQELARSPYVSMSLQSGLIRPRGQNTSVGTPWNSGQLVYEDSYVFGLEGEFQQLYIPGEGYRLRRIDIVPEHSEKHTDNHLSNNGGWV